MLSIRTFDVSGKDFQRFRHGFLMLSAMIFDTFGMDLLYFWQAGAAESLEMNAIEAGASKKSGRSCMRAINEGYAKLLWVYAECSLSVSSVF